MGYHVLNRGNALSKAESCCEIEPCYQVVAEDAFKNNIKIKVMVMPTICHIGKHAFYHCTALREVKSSKLISVKSEAFALCVNLNKVILPPSLSQMGKSCFYKCKRLEAVSFRGNRLCGELPFQSFAECGELSKVILPMNLHTLGSRAFYKCENLHKIKLPSSLQRIESRAFYQCGLQQIELPEHLEFIGESAFLKCKKLEYVRIPKSVKTIEKWAFHGCGNLKVLEIHHDPEVVGDWITNKNCIIRCARGSRMEEYAKRFEIGVEHL